MARRSSTAWDTKPYKPIRYGAAARLADLWAGRGDGKAAIPAITAVPTIQSDSAEILDPHVGMTPYLEIRSRHFLDSAERERRRMLTDLDPVYRRRAALRQEVESGDEKVADIRKRLDTIPEMPHDVVLDSRNAVEMHADEALIRARRLREHNAARAMVLAEEQQAVETVRVLRVEEARLTETIMARERILESRVRQLHEHTLRRCGTYLHHLVRKHRDGAGLIPFLDLALPTLPDWLPHHDTDAGPPIG